MEIKFFSDMTKDETPDLVVFRPGEELSEAALNSAGYSTIMLDPKTFEFMEKSPNGRLMVFSEGAIIPLSVFSVGAVEFAKPSVINSSDTSTFEQFATRFF